MSRDAAATILLQEWPIQVDLFDVKAVIGPVPLLFAPSPAEASAAITANPERTFRDLQRIYAKIAMPENLPAAAALFIAGYFILK